MKVVNYFKFQSDSINTDALAQTMAGVIFFKFQSDSINTVNAAIVVILK